MRRVRIACGCRTWLFVVLSMAAAASPSVSAEDEGVVIAKASDAAKLAIQGFKAPPGATVELVAAEPELANPVAFCFDEQGRIYVAETFRQDHGVEDDRGHMNWLEDDLSLQTVEQRGEMFRHYLGDKVNDWAKYPERVRRLEDRDGDGRYETATVFASGFNDILDGTGAGVLARRGNVYYTCIPNLWLLRDTDDDGAADVRTVLQHGFGVRTAFRGHDMHGLIWGPDGRLYFSIGDRGYNVETKEGTHLKRPDAGAVFRCEPDGSGLEVYAYGLRNPQELAFNDEGDLFTGDNNSDGGDQARWVYVAPEGDSGWRMYYQYPQDRGPWNRERMWHPYRDDEKTAAVQPAYIVPPIRNFADGPSGVVFDPGVGLPESQRGRFFLVDFRGTPGTSGVRSFRAQPKGAGFQLIDEDWAVQSMLATDVEFGLDGAMYVLDWVDGWTGAGKGRIYRVKFDDGASEQSNVVELFRGGFAKFPDDGLFSLLGHRDRRVRQEAQFELADRAVRQRRERGDAALAEKLLRLAMTGDSPASRHALWATGQVVRLTERPVGSLEELTGSPSAEMRRQAYRIAADAPTSVFGGMSEWHRRAFIKGLSDPEPRVRFMAAIAIARRPVWVSHIAIVGGASIIGLILGDAAWLIGPMLVAWVARHRRSVTALHFTWIAVLFLLTPLYRPYPRLLLPLVASSWLALGAIFEDLIGGETESTTTAGRGSPAKLVVKVGLAVACVVLLWQGGTRRNVDGAEPALTLRSACESMQPALGRDHTVAFLVRPPVLVYQPWKPGFVRLDPERFTDWLEEARDGNQPSWLCVDGALLRDNPTLKQSLDAAIPSLRVRARFDYRPVLAVLMDDFGRGASELSNAALRDTYHLTLYELDHNRPLTTPSDSRTGQVE